MSNLKELRSKLMSIQQKSSGNKLSERNVVDIMQKLIENFSLNVIYTISGKEYITPSRLINDMVKEVTQEGRVNLLDLPTVLNVSIEQIEFHVSSVVSADIYLINGQLLSSFYIESMCQEINLTLQESGQLSLADLTYKYSVPMSFLKEQIEKRLGKSIQASMSANSTLVTDSYLLRHLGKLRGSLRAAIKPYDLKQFDQTLVLSHIQKLIETGQIKGFVDGMNFVPSVFQSQIWEEIKDYYYVNRYVEYDYIKKRMVYLTAGDYKKACEKLGNGEFLAECYMNPELIEEVKSKLQDLMKNKSFVDFYDAELPVCIREEDLETFLLSGIYIASHFLYTEKAVEQAVNLLGPMISAFSEETKEPVSKGKKKETLSKEAIESELKKKKFLNAPAEFLENFSDFVYTKASQKITQNRETRSKPAELVPDNISNDFNYLVLCNKSLQAIHKVHANIKPLQVHYCKTAASSLLGDLLKVELNHHGVQVSDIKANERAKMIQKLPDYLKEIFIKLNEKIAAKDIDGFINELLQNIKDIPVVSLKSVDKKTERTVLHKLKSEAKNKFRKAVSEENFGDAGIFAAKIKLMETGVLIDVPSEKWGISLVVEIYLAMMPHDICVDFLRACENDRNSGREMVSELVSYLALDS